MHWTQSFGEHIIPPIQLQPFPPLNSFMVAQRDVVGKYAIPVSGSHVIF